VEWASSLTVIGVITAVLGLQTLRVAHALTTLGDEMYRGFDRIEARLDRLERRKPPSLRRV
jgi:hypothetical protein